MYVYLSENSLKPKTATEICISVDITLNLRKNNKIIIIYKPQHDKTNKMACAPSIDSDQPGQPPSLIRVFAVRMKKAWVLSYPLSAQRRLIRLGGCLGWSESLLGP